MNEQLAAPANSAVSIIDGQEVVQCVGFPEYYITRDGKVWSTIQKKWRKTHPNVKSGYLQVGLRGHKSQAYVHRLVAEAYLGRRDGLHVDHINRDRQDNRAENLRWVSVSGNASNCKAKGAKSGFRGVHPLHNGTWQVRFKRDCKMHHIGTFRCPSEAAMAYDKAIRDFEGEHAITNF